MKINNFLHKRCLWFNFEYMCSGFLCCVTGLISPVHGSSNSFYMSIGPVFFIFLFLSFVVNFWSDNSHFPVTTFGLDQFSGACLEFTVSVIPIPYK